MYKFTKQHKDSAIGDECTYTGDYLQALIDAGIVEEVKNRLKGMPSVEMTDKFIHNTLHPFIRIQEDDAIDLFKTGNYFPTEQAAKEHNDWLIMRTRLARACHEISGGENGFRKGKRNYYALYDHYSSSLVMNWFENNQQLESFLYLRTEAQAQRLINDHSDALKVYLGVE